MKPQSTDLALNDAFRELAAAESLDEIKTIRDKAEAIRAYVKNARLGLEAQNQAGELKLRAQRRAGELLAGLHLRGGNRLSNGHRDRLKLDDLGITQSQSKRWQKEATLPEEEFEDFIEQANRLGEEISTASLMRRTGRWRGNGHPDRQEAEHSEKPSPCTYSDVLQTIAELKDHHEALLNLLAPAGSDPPPEPNDDRLLHLAEIAELVARLEKLLR